MNKNLLKIVSGLVGGLGLAVLLLFATPALASDGTFTIYNSPTSATVIQGASVTPIVTFRWTLNGSGCAQNGCGTANTRNTTVVKTITGCPTGATCSGFMYGSGIVANVNYSPMATIQTSSDTPAGTYRVYFTLSEYSYDGGTTCQSQDTGGSPCFTPVTSYIDITVNAPAPACKNPTTGSMSGPSSINISTPIEIGCDYGSDMDYINGPAGLTFVRHDGTIAIFSGTSPSSAQTKTYTCSPANPGAPFTNWCSLPASMSKNVTIIDPTPASTVDIKANGSDGSVAVAYNASASISWTSTNATSCTTSPNIGTGSSNSGVSTGGLTSSQTYTINCTGVNGNSSDSVTVVPGLPPSTADIKANSSDSPATIAYNSPATLSWTSSNASSCTTSPNVGSGTSNSSVSTGNLTTSTTYTLSCTGSGGNSTDTVTVNVSPAPPTVDIKANGSNGPVSISYNTAATISWTSTNATSCTTSPNIGTGTSNSGVSTGNLTSSRTYSITCTGAGGTDTDTVSVNPGAIPAPTADIKADGSDGPVSIAYNGASTLSWTSTQAASCSVTPGTWTDTVNTGVSTGSLTTSKTYTLTCTNATGSASNSVVVNVTSQPVPVVTLTANPTTGDKPLDSTLTWTTTNSPTSCTASGVPGNSWTGAKTTTGGSQVLNNIPNTYTYVLTCTNSGGSGEASVTITPTTANAAPVAPTITGATTGVTGSSYTFTVSATDPESNQIRYGIDWNMDGVADLWVPAGVTYVPSGTSQTGSNTWNSTGTKTFQALAQDAPGLNSGWTSYSIAISNPVIAPSVTIDASPRTGVSPMSTNISWITSNSPASCTASGGWSGSKSTSGGNQDFSGISSGTTYTITCTNSAGSDSASITVTPSTVYSLSVIKTYGGSVKAGDNLINCGPTCANNYVSGTNVTLTAYPDSAQWKFIGWQGACTGTSTCSVSVTGAKTVTAQFALKPLIYQEF